MPAMTKTVLLLASLVLLVLTSPVVAADSKHLRVSFSFIAIQGVQPPGNFALVFHRRFRLLSLLRGL
jgi:hypothetical protein